MKFFVAMVAFGAFVMLCVLLIAWQHSEYRACLRHLPPAGGEELCTYPGKADPRVIGVKLIGVSGLSLLTAYLGDWLVVRRATRPVVFWIAVLISGLVFALGLRILVLGRA